MGELIELKNTIDNAVTNLNYEELADPKYLDDLKKFCPLDTPLATALMQFNAAGINEIIKNFDGSETVEEIEVLTALYELFVGGATPIGEIDWPAFVANARKVVALFTNIDDPEETDEN